MALVPPTSTPGPYKPPMAPPGLPTQSLPHVRYYTPKGNETLGDLASMFYGNTREAVRIYNANRVGQLRSDRTPGFIVSLHDTLTAGMPVIVP